MGAIAAVVGESTHSTHLNTMLKKLEHRGSEAHNVMNKNQVQLGNKRLAVIDPENGMQPVSNESEDIWIVYDGEIYNHDELKANYLENYLFQSRADSETLLHLYEEFGTKALQYLDGMFAFIIADFRFSEPKLFAARDPFGVKPMYYGKENGVLFMASEMKALFDNVTDIYEFPEGYCYTTDEGFIPFRTIDAFVSDKSLSKQQDLQTTTAAVRQKLDASVQKQLKSYVPLGVFLSGGLDSSLLAGIAKQYYQDARLKSFSVGFQDSNDLIAAKEVATRIGTEHYEYVYTEKELWEAIPHVIYHLESFEPSLVRSAIPNYFLSKLAAQHVKVILSGEGADEIFGGYDYFKNIENHDELHHEMLRTLHSMHNVGLQRLDRMTMAHALEARAPFLDEDLVRYASQIPVTWKLREEEDEKTEKWILRQSFDNTELIPHSVLWRTKAEFSEGSGSKDLLDRRVDQEISDEEWEREQERIFREEGVDIRSKMELHFYRIFRNLFPRSALGVAGRWVTS